MQLLLQLSCDDIDRLLESDPALWRGAKTDLIHFNKNLCGMRKV